MKVIKKISSANFFIPPILILLLAGLVVRIVLSFFGTLHLDQGTFISWSNILVEKGFKHFYEGWSDYLPGYLYILFLLGKIKSFFSPLPEEVLYKLPAIFSDIVTGGVIYLVVKKLKSERLGLVSAAFYLFNPAIWANSALWGQVDSLTALFAILSLWLIERNFFLSAVFLSIGALIKPQAAIVSIIIAFYMLSQRWKARNIAGYILTSFSVFVLGFLPFVNNGNIFLFIWERLNKTVGQYPYASINAFNLWGLWGFWGPEKIGQAPLIVIGILVTLGIIFWLSKALPQKENRYLITAIAFLSSFLLFTRVHERHLLPVFAPLIIASSLNPFLWIVYLGLSVTYLANLYYSYQWISHDFLRVYSVELIEVFIILNLICFFLILVESFKQGTLKKIFSKLSFDRSVTKVSLVKFPVIELSKKFTIISLLLITLFSFMTRVFALNDPPKEYFDEVYHAFTAKTMLHHDPKAWEWWNTSPEGFAYEWTHPPLAKLGMVLGMTLFGENSFGWRIPGAILGTGSVVLVFFIAKFFFNDNLLALFSSLAFSLDGLALVMSRIGMNDSYFLFFVLLSLYLYFKDKNFLSSVSLGLSLASKWSAIWALPIFAVSHFALKKKFKSGYFWFIVIPSLVYIASYTNMFLEGHSFDIFVGVQKQMWWYHTGLKATHPYTSSWWTWPLLLRPIWLYTSGEVSGFISNIYAFGNPFIFWAGLASIFISLWVSFKERNRKLGLVVFSYLIFFVPWAASPRIMFLYHYLPSIPFLAISIGYVLRKFPRFAKSFFIASFLIFIYFYPHWSGLKIPLWLSDSYFWFSSWR